MKRAPQGYFSVMQWNYYENRTYIHIFHLWSATIYIYVTWILVVLFVVARACCWSMLSRWGRRREMVIWLKELINLPIAIARSVYSAVTMLIQMFGRRGARVQHFLFVLIKANDRNGGNDTCDCWICYVQMSCRYSASREKQGLL